MLVVFAATSAIAQQRFDSGPYKGFIKEEPPLNTKEIPHAFEVRVISGTLTFGEHPLADAFFEIRDNTGQVFTTKTDEHGAFSIANPKPGLSDNVDPCQTLFERTAPCTPKSAPFRSS